MNPEELRRRILEKYPTGVTHDGIKYYDLPVDELARRVVAKYPGGVTHDGIPYSSFLKKDDRNFFEKINDFVVQKVSMPLAEISGIKTLAERFGGEVVNKGAGLVAMLAPSGSELERRAEQVEDYARENEPTLKQTAGAAAKLGLTAATFGSPGLAANVPGFLGTAARTAEFAATGGAIQAASNIEHEEPITEGLLPTVVLSGLTVPMTEGAVSLAGAIFRGFPEKLINSEIKPLLRDLSYGKNPGRGVLDEGIVANSLEELETKLNAVIKKRGAELSRMYETPEAEAMRLSARDVFAPLDDAITTAQKNPKTNANLIKRLRDTRDDLLQTAEVPVGNTTTVQNLRKVDDLTPRELFELKQDVAELTRFTGAKSDDEITNKALKQVYGRIKGRLNDALPGLQEANEHFADLKSAQIATKYRELINQRQNIVGLVNKIGIVGELSVSLAWAVATGDWKTAGSILGATLLGNVAVAAGGSVAAKTRLAKLLNALSPTDRARLIRNVPVVRRILGN